MEDSSPPPRSRGKEAEQVECRAALSDSARRRQERPSGYPSSSVATCRWEVRDRVLEKGRGQYGEIPLVARSLRSAPQPLPSAVANIGCLRGERRQPLLAEDMVSRCRSPKLVRSFAVCLGAWGCLSTSGEDASAPVPGYVREVLGQVAPQYGTASGIATRAAPSVRSSAPASAQRGRGFPPARASPMAAPVDRGRSLSRRPSPSPLSHSRTCCLRCDSPSPLGRLGRRSPCGEECGRSNQREGTDGTPLPWDGGRRRSPMAVSPYRRYGFPYFAMLPS